jgi:hypothetical protein
VGYPEHINYSDFPDLLDPVQLASHPSESVLLKLLQEHPSVQLNVARNAIQVFGKKDDLVLMHIPLPQSMREKLQVALAPAYPQKVIGLD